MRGFSISKYGEEEARALAIECRRQAVKRLLKERWRLIRKGR
jgi:hypothetical protein